jgi:hypothetical protein
VALGGRLPESLEVVAEEADQDDGEHDQGPVLPELEGVVPVIDLARRVQQVEALVEHVARADVVHPRTDQVLSV